ncbi:hypothetical protein BGX33_001542 [Mortierella sp. NVP41]|nr:hypothetical protein BGX33_001542 [Mortierella sp. NVP41]
MTTGSASDSRVVTTTSSSTTTTIRTGAPDDLEEAGMMDFHIFWQGVITDKLSLLAHSFLFSQPLDRARLHLWIDSSNLPGGVAEDYSQNPFATDLVSEPLNQYIKTHVWDQAAQHEFAYPTATTDADEGGSLEAEAEGSTYSDSTTNEPHLTPPVALSDEARFLILSRYGRMYLDADVLLLRDMSPFYDSGMEFAYEWSNTQMHNTAILRLDRGSSVARRILHGALAREKEIQEKTKSRELTAAGGGDGGDDDVKSESSKEVKMKGVDVDLLRLEAKTKKRVRGGGNSKNYKWTDKPSKPSSAAAGVDAPSTNDQAGGDNGDDILGSGDSDSLFATTTPPPIHPHLANVVLRRLAKRGEMRLKEIYYPARLRGYLCPEDSALKNNVLTMIPTAIFDPLWLRIDGAESKTGLVLDAEMTVEKLRTFPDAFSIKRDSVCPGQGAAGGGQGGQGEKKGFTAGPEVFAMGAYAYHWHNNWVTPIEEGSWMGLMREAYGAFLAGERSNLYGEWFRGDSDAFLFMK